MNEQQEKKNRLMAGLTSLGVHLAMLILFVFVMGWSAPNPPLSELGSGVELNLGLDQEGTGDVQVEIPTGGNEKPAETQVQEQKDKPAEQKEEVKEKESKPEEQNLSATEESPVAAKEVKKEVKKPEPVKEKPVDVKPKLKEEALYDPKKDNKKEVKESATTKETGQAGKNAPGLNQGDDKNKKGDKGSPEGSLDPKAAYTGKAGTGGPGSGGGGNGFALNMAGWAWDTQPAKPKLPDNENGKIVFEIEVDGDGQITRIKTIERTLSLEAESICKQEIQKRSLVRTSAGAVPDRSAGRITFVLHTQ